MNNNDLQVQGFLASAGRGGIRGKDRLDIGLIYSEVPAVVAGVFTTSLVKAAPVLLDMERVRSGQGRAILINSSIANACTGDKGRRMALESSAFAAKALKIPEDMVLVASTGVIGEQLELTPFEKVMGRMAADLSSDGFMDVAQAMMTTDTVPKTAVRTVIVGGKDVKLLGLVKGAGMIRPDMATMLCFVMTDGDVSSDALRIMLKRSVNCSFNLITVDGDTSTNDTVLILANAMAGNSTICENNPSGMQVFQEGLDELLKDLAMQMVEDGEGATKLVTIEVKGGRNDEEARIAAFTVAESSLVKTAFFGEDANWGRIIGALGRSGANFDPYSVDIGFDDVLMVKNGMGLGLEAEARATRVLKQRKFTVNINLNAGTSICRVITSDLSLDYVRINADYRS
ncbi:MAG: bifunctional glutamate N-acetyltransferase/amino-acid acetyltransferase ArgJ [Desulfobulbaceae bacterium]|nr:bifunctional glutamate N-acetyltransferase/amino-acid acetyltransferase ArgJ [Desulfobulbaceae bacterium]MCK5436685.1 bifunctional glutamate N-acetyltransferase/amino-acid acetyltransferase ArgJ [Desulfobulbaceae bacterium]MCK5544102.1 bifunctional glutamate N-acetyltransferase/amino-acid acetyltransferase ArgJ [Desulfobulbaceae bacterium]